MALGIVTPIYQGEHFMAEERITEHTDRAGNTHTTHTIVHDKEPANNGNSGWLILLLVLVVAVVGVWFLTQMSDSEIAKDNAVAGAADEVGQAAGQVGDAAQTAGEAVENATNQ